MFPSLELSQTFGTALTNRLSTEKKKTHNLKVENYVLFGRLSEDLSPGGSLSDSSKGLFPRGKGGSQDI